MRYSPHTQQTIDQMLELIGVSNIAELFKGVDPSLMLEAPEDNGMAEYTVLEKLAEEGQKNRFHQLTNFAGCGSYEHQRPSLISHICQRGEFLTTYTPYQAEASQGLLQAIFEFQTVVSQLTGCPIANASMYDGASAAAEALLLGCRVHNKAKKVLVSQGVHPHIRQVIHLYFSGLEIEVEEIPLTADRLLDAEALNERLDESVGACLFASPNVYGLFEEDQLLIDTIKSHSATAIVYPLVHAMAYKQSLGALGADIVCGDLQPVAMPMNFGGPYVGYIAAQKEYMRQMPGRLVSITEDTEGQRAFTLTLQTREQHIRREKATSNICSNQALAALASLVTLSWYGTQGLQEAALACYQRAHYLADCLKSIEGINVIDRSEYFHEFIIEFKQDAKEIIDAMVDKGIYPGINVQQLDPTIKNQLLVAVTEVKSKKQLDNYCIALEEVINANNL